MKKIIALVLCMLILFALSSCSTPVYPCLPDASGDEKEPMKGVDIYCRKDGGEWKCGGIIGANITKSDEDIRSLQVVSIPEMKIILYKKGLSDCFSVILVDLFGDEVVYPRGEEYDTERACSNCFRR